MIQYITECREGGVDILPPDINKSEKAFTILDNKIRFGLSGIKNVGDAAIDHILAVRDELGEFTSFTQFCSALDNRKANKKVLESLAKAGCFDKMGLKRSQVLNIIQEKLDKLQKKDQKNSYQQLDMFGTSLTTSQTLEIPNIDELEHSEILSGEKEALGFYFSQHPLKSYEDLIKQVTSYDTLTLKETDAAEDVNIVAIVNGCKEIVTKKGDRMAYLTLEDTKGIVEAIVFPDLYSKNVDTIKGDKPLFINGSVERGEDGSVKIRVKNLTLFDNIMAEMGKTVKINIRCETFKKEELRKLRDVLVSLSGKARVLLEFQLNGEKKRVKLNDIRIDHSKVDVLLKHFSDGIRVEVTDEILS